MTTKAKPRASRRWLSPLNIPSGKSGNAEVRQTVKPPGEKVMLGNLRTAMFGQGVYEDPSWPFPTTWHELLIDGGRMMSDWPIEQRQHDRELKGFRGRVLVGGLGLGYAATRLLARRSVTSVTVIEINPGVVELVRPHLTDPDGKLTVIEADLFEWLKWHDGELFDRAFYDVWSSDGEGTFFMEVMPLYELSRGKVRRPPVNWNEGVMRGQLFSSLRNRLLFLQPGAMEHLGRPIGWRDPWEPDGTDRPWHNWSVPFFRWWKEAEPSDDAAEHAARIYAGCYGAWSWEEQWRCVTR